jgi:hypothetical protein
MLRLAPIGAGDRATYRATELREPQRREPSDDGLNKPQSPARMWFRRYRTQEVAGSSPASSTVEALHVRGFCFFYDEQMASSALLHPGRGRQRHGGVSR